MLSHEPSATRWRRCNQASTSSKARRSGQRRDRQSPRDHRSTGRAPRPHGRRSSRRLVRVLRETRFSFAGRSAGPPAGRRAGDRRQSGAPRGQRRPAGDESRGRAGLRQRGCHAHRSSGHESHVERLQVHCRRWYGHHLGRAGRRRRSVPSCRWSTPGSGWNPHSCRGYSNHSYRPTAPSIAWRRGDGGLGLLGQGLGRPPRKARSVREVPGLERARSSRFEVSSGASKLGSRAPFGFRRGAGRPAPSRAW